MKLELLENKGIKREEKILNEEIYKDNNKNIVDNLENNSYLMNSKEKELFEALDEEDELKNNFKRLICRKRNKRNLSDTSSSSSSIESFCDNNNNMEFNKSYNDNELIEEKKTKKWNELIVKEDNALSYCLDISLNMKEGIIKFFVGNETKNELRNEIIDNIKDGRCNISRITEELKKSEIFKYISNFGDSRIKEYQIVGVSWLLALHNNSYNGILADEMGLGKTAQTCIWLQFLFDSGKLVKPVIITCPASLLDNWTKEISIWAPKLRSIKYHGSQKDRRRIADELLIEYEDNNIDAIITTFQMLSNKLDINMIFKHLEFSYMIVDEAHNIKNSSSQRYKFMSKKIRSERKLLLTGTPISNSISELSNMLIFLMPDIFNSELLDNAFNSYKRQFSSLLNDKEDNNSEILFLQEIIAPFVLRRSKKDVLCCIPEKHVFIEYCELTNKQEEQYNMEINGFNKNRQLIDDKKDDNIVNIIQKKIEDKVNSHFNIKNEIELNNYSNLNVDSENEDINRHHYDPKYVNSIIFRMRRICNHSLLHQGYYKNKEIEDLINYLMNNIDEYKNYPKFKVEQHINQLCDYEIHQLITRYINDKNYNFLKKFKIDDNSIINGGCKLIRMNEIIKKNVIEKNEKCLIFCHHTMLLDIIEEYIKIKYDLPDLYLRLDGTTPILERQLMIEKFQNSNVLLFLLSTKAAGQGLNLTNASIVIMMDLDYNPQIEKQAEDRVHRIGQNKQVKIFKLVCRNTIEENIFNCCQSKLSLDNAFGGNN